MERNEWEYDWLLHNESWENPYVEDNSEPCYDIGYCNTGDCNISKPVDEARQWYIDNGYFLYKIHALTKNGTLSGSGLNSCENYPSSNEVFDHLIETSGGSGHTYHSFQGEGLLSNYPGIIYNWSYQMISTANSVCVEKYSPPVYQTATDSGECPEGDHTRYNTQQHFPECFTREYWVKCSSFECPPGSTMINGICGPNPGYAPNPNGDGTAEEPWFIPSCKPVCVGVKGPTEIRPNSSYEYEAYFEEDDCTEDSERVIFLSYNASNMTNGVDFIAPTSVKVKSGENFTKFAVIISADCEEPGAKHMQIDATSSYVDTICGNVKAQLNCEKFEPGDIDNCMDLFFFEPYGHKVRKANNM